ncbi:class I SAM-dependent methyltransferase [Flavihumibacter petaseus]|uniref:Putative methyltransferase n=1 Tax=Flavihumibacter petaseus NBRC 106054 TaxID=1220578 RepID=A0A0E9N5H6_9BACT|nr:class I SAM-dependent methyltransferase [Flavihumibacter petaseus]GAO45058.1 putative methyltransferase [Flavihumibacter petaseus NBRC 106054]
METATTSAKTAGAPAIDMGKMESFLNKVVSDFGSSLSITLSFIGDKLGLYKAMAFAGPVTAADLAKKTNTTERYVREWLINQAAGGYIEFDEKKGTYRLPDEHAVALTDENSPFYVAGGFQVISSMQKAEERITELFKTGAGMLWGEHHHGLFEGTERFFRPGYTGNLVAQWLPALEGVVDKLKKGALVADIGCGHGISTMIMARAFPQSNFVGYDNHVPSIERANALAGEEGLKNVRFDVGSAQKFPDRQFDLIAYFDCLHDMGDPVGAMAHAREVLKDDGTIMLVEPMAGRKAVENLNPVGRVYSGASVLCCSPNAMASGGYVLGTVASDQALEEVSNKAGFKRFRRAAETPFNRVFEVRK